MAGREYKLPIPTADEASEPFFRGAKERKLMLLRCTGCGHSAVPRFSKQWRVLRWVEG